jgi:hypothetical protein
MKLEFPDIQSFHISAYIEHLLTEKSVPTVKLSVCRVTSDKMAGLWIVNRHLA